MTTDSGFRSGLKVAFLAVGSDLHRLADYLIVDRK